MVAALICGALTAWFLGLRNGIIAAVATAVLLVIAMVVPGMSLAVYALVLAWCAGLWFFGKKLAKVTDQKGLIGGPLATASSWAGTASSWVKSKLGGKDEKKQAK